MGKSKVPGRMGFEKYAHLSHQQGVQGVVNKRIGRVGRLESKESCPGIALTEKKTSHLKKISRTGKTSREKAFV